MVKYSYKEKKYHFNALRNTDSASVDLELLLRLCPEHPDKRRFTLYAKKLGDEILLSLLDFATKEEIREFRRKKSEHIPKTVSQPEVPSPEPERKPEFSTESDTETDDSEQRVADAEQRAAEAEERAEDAEQRAEEAEDRAEQAEQILEKEKKKEHRIPVKSKRKKSSPK